MPNAIAGEESTSNGKPSYEYTIKIDIITVEKFYTDELSKKGWLPFSGDWASLEKGNDAFSLFAKGKMKGKELPTILTVRIITAGKADNLQLVTLEKAAQH